MHEWNFGSIDCRQLCVRVFVPWLTLRNWHRVVFSRWSWRLWCKWHRHGNHRCYCCVGHMFDGHIWLAGFGLQWFYSYYPGPSRCCCDEVMDELYEVAAKIANAALQQDSLSGSLGFCEIEKP